MRLNIQLVNFSEIVRTAVEAVAPVADAKDVTVETVLDPAASAIWGDPDRLQQVLWNLTSNAVKFSNRGGKVQVCLNRSDAHVEVIVSDSGVGISPEFMPHIFERFRQAETGLTRERGGLGLGLAIARELVDMHGGTIDASSAGPGHGATFRVTLPVKMAAAQ
jgi:signal transduction histidine kinase